MRNRARERWSESGAQGRRLMESARDAAERAGSVAQEIMSRWSDRAQHMAGELADDAREQVERFTGRDVNAWTRDVRTFVQERPLQAVLVTVAIGYVLGKMLKRG